jgi:hypothetical protein
MSPNSFVVTHAVEAPRHKRVTAAALKYTILIVQFKLLEEWYKKN